MNATSTPGPWQTARRAARMNPSVIREILKVTERPGIISLAGGLPSPDTFPVLSFVTVPPAQIAQGIQFLAEALMEQT